MYIYLNIYTIIHAEDDGINTQTRSRKHMHIRKYMYEYVDKYTFVRILTAYRVNASLYFGIFLKIATCFISNVISHVLTYNTITHQFRRVISRDYLINNFHVYRNDEIFHFHVIGFPEYGSIR